MEKVKATVWFGQNNKTKSRTFENFAKASAWVRKMREQEDVSEWKFD